MERSVLQQPGLINGDGRVSDLCDLDGEGRRRSCDDNGGGQEEGARCVGLYFWRSYKHQSNQSTTTPLPQSNDACFSLDPHFALKDPRVSWHKWRYFEKKRSTETLVPGIARNLRTIFETTGNSCPWKQISGLQWGVRVATPSSVCGPKVFELPSKVTSTSQLKRPSQLSTLLVMYHPEKSPCFQRSSATSRLGQPALVNYTDYNFWGALTELVLDTGRSTSTSASKDLPWNISESRYRRMRVALRHGALTAHDIRAPPAHGEHTEWTEDLEPTETAQDPRDRELSK
ncbi:hypothetical protein B0H17DRAFT_1142045 [Mycena rosella]|uniref:Uncharacterized protein n=1 Tax=Mycena rosella TaxID=1033263 RepID=A0AAD7CYH4_MYCRO|nr:hypothetical protein B0H17DRAFT_1142045 [Mycena rosella]